MIVLSLDNFDSRFVHFGEPVKNNIINNGNFHHINYSTNTFSLNTIYVNVPLKMKTIDQGDRMKILFKIKDNEKIIDRIRKLEEEIIKDKNQYKISRYLESEMINIHSSFCENFVLLLKISGLWETENQKGLSFKFVIHPLNNV